MPHTAPSPDACWRNDAHGKVTGALQYTDDLKLPNMLHAVPVYSDHVHARIKTIHLEQAIASPGVVHILTAQDVPGAKCHGQIIRDYPIFAFDRIRSCGDVYALVVAERRQQALAAAALVRLDAEALPCVLDMEAALRPEAPLVHEERGSNLINEHRIRRGDATQGFAECDLVLERRWETPRIEHAYLEPECALAIPRPDGSLEIHGSMQHPFSTQRFTAAYLGLPLSRVEVIGGPMGGGFGGKDDTAAIVCARAALAAMLTGRPVKIRYAREWSMRESYKRHPYRVDYKMGFKRDGHLHACQVRILADGGAYCSVTPWVTWRSTVQCCGPYEVPHVHCDTFGVYTHNIFTGAMRGFGSPQMNFILESMMDMAALELGIDAIKIRQINMLRQGSTTITGQKLDSHTVSLDEVFKKALKASDFEEKVKKCGAISSKESYGIGFAISYRGMSLGAEGVDGCSAEIVVQTDGSVVLETGVHENGQGAQSAMMLACARELGLSIDRIHYRRPSTHTIPDSGSTVASRGTLMGSGAVVKAAEGLKAKLASALAVKSVKCQGGRVLSLEPMATGNTDMTWEAAIAKMYSQQKHPVGLGTFQAPKVDWNEDTGQGNAYFTWVYGCQVAEVLVNHDTGRIKVLSLTAAHDVGWAINPAMVLGQFYGGMAQGLGYALMEEVEIKEGRVQSLNFNRYRIPRAMDMPEMEAIIIENPDPLSPSGAKGCGEPTLEITAPAIANAVFRATGQRHYQLPLRLEKPHRP